MIEITAVIVSQFSLVFFKHLNVVMILKEELTKSMILTALIQISWLVSSAIGINALLKNDFITVVAYVIAGVIGSYFALKTQVNKPRRTTWTN